jgi:hypothetical protein
MPIMNLAEEIARYLPTQTDVKTPGSVGSSVAVGAIGGIIGGLLGGRDKG